MFFFVFYPTDYKPMKRRYRTKNDSYENRIFCENCNFSCRRVKDLRFHKAWECGQELKCVHCYKHFVARSSLVAHIKKQSKNFSCLKKKKLKIKTMKIY